MKNSIVTVLVLSLLFMASDAFAQFGEPDVIEKEEPRNLYDEGYKVGFGFLFSLNDFGAGVGGQFRFGLDAYTEALASFKIAGLRDPSEQAFIDYTFGFKTIPDKYRRVLSFPVFVGMKKRFFARDIADNFRLHASIEGGPVYAISYDYFNDKNNNGVKDRGRTNFGRDIEPVYDIFAGFKDVESHLGFGGDLVLGVDFGDNFASLSSLQFGYTAHYFADGIQILEPNRLVYDNQGNQVGVAPANGPRNFFGSAQINLVFGWMW